MHQSKLSTSIFQTVGRFYAFLCVVNPLPTAQLLLLLCSVLLFLIHHSALQSMQLPL